MTMHDPVTVATVQMVSGTDVEANLATAARLVGEAAAAGARLVVLPEYFVLMGRTDADKVAVRERFGDGPMQAFCRDLAHQHGVWLVAGTIPIDCGSPDKVYNTTLVYDDHGEVRARYDKMHLFGFTRGEERYEESRTIDRGDEVITLDAPFGRLGLAICYDIRFPELFRAMGEVDMLIVPAAFTRTTGRAHWEILLRARAIENQCFLIASGQGGHHENGRDTFGHSMVIDPWGEVLGLREEGEGVVVARLDPQRLVDVRTNLPALQHRILREPVIDPLL